MLGGSFAVWERVTPSPMLDLDLFRNPRFAVASLGLSSASFALMATAFLLTQYLQFAHGYSPLGAGAAMVPLAAGLALGAGNVLAPTTESIMGAVPPHRAGVASAMNDVNRMVAGAVGVAVIGSLTSTAYHDRAAAALPTLPDRSRGAAEASIGSSAAHADAQRIPVARAGDRHAEAGAAAGVDGQRARRAETQGDDPDAAPAAAARDVDGRTGA